MPIADGIPGPAMEVTSRNYTALALYLGPLYTMLPDRNDLHVTPEGMCLVTRLAHPATWRKLGDCQDHLLGVLDRWKNVCINDYTRVLRPME
eukprot:477427-Karenia_brevis.AAC.1